MNNMKYNCLTIFLISLSSAAPQYSDQPSDNELNAINDFVREYPYDEIQTEDLDGIDDVVTNEDGYIAPDDYQQPMELSLFGLNQQPMVDDLTDKATTIVDNTFDNCADYEGQGYECVPYYQCHNGTIVTDGSGLIDIRNGFGILSIENSFCQGFLDVCCLDPDFIAPPPPLPKYQPRCGRRHENGLGVRIQGFKDSESQFGEWPHMCAILSEEQVGSSSEDGYTQVQEAQPINIYQCGGSLIAPGTILTAAHCVDKFRNSPGTLKVRCGEWDTQNQTEPRPHQDRYVEDLDIHPEFNQRSLANDWAVLYMEESFDLDEHIDTVCLPQPEEEFDQQPCFATGWGKDKFGSAGQYQVVLKEIGLQVMEHSECQEKLRTTRLGKRFSLDKSFMCAGGEGEKDTCKGDGGSPLVCPSSQDPNTYIQAGIVAWGIGCGEENIPGVYASVSEGVCWIDYAMSCHYGSLTGDYSSFWGYLDNQCQDWMDMQVVSLTERVDAMTNVEHLSGRRRAMVLDSGIKAQRVLEHYSQCNVDWFPREDVDSQSLIEGGYVDDSQDSYSPETAEADSYVESQTPEPYLEPKIVEQSAIVQTAETYDLRGSDEVDGGAY